MTAEQTRAAQKASTEAQARVKRENARAMHTPGPWKALGLLMGFGYVIKYDNADGVESIAYIQAYDIDLDTPEPYGKWSDVNKANHDLVLAAPDLLAALQRIVTALDKQVASPHLAERASPLAQAKAAISKATGETQ